MARDARATRLTAAALLLMLVWSGLAIAQGSQSAPLTEELARLMGERNLQAIAAAHPHRPHHYVAAMLFPGVQLLLVAGQPSAPEATAAQLEARQYAEVYSLLHQAVVPESNVFFQDLKADGLHARANDTVDIMYERAVDQTIFDGAPSKHKITDGEYDRKFLAADAKYATLLTILIEKLKAEPQ